MGHTVHYPKGLIASPVWLAPALLIATGALRGSVLPVADAALRSGLSPIDLAYATQLGAGALILLLALALGHRVPLTGRHIAFYVTAGLISFAAPNALLLLVLPHLGVGMTAVLQALPPLLTLLGALTVGCERPGASRVAGLALGAGGTLAVLGVHGAGGNGSETVWALIALGVPALIALGNVYRSLAWPPGTTPFALGAGMMLAASLWLAPLTLLFGSGPALPGVTTEQLPLLGAHVGLTALVLPAFLIIQRMAGPVYPSQIGYLSALFGLAAGTLILDEHYSGSAWLGALAIVAGVLLCGPGGRKRSQPTTTQGVKR